MNVRKLIALTLVLGLLLPAVVAAAPTPAGRVGLGLPQPVSRPLSGPCVAAAAYDPACDVDHDGDVDIFDVQKTAGHWNQSGVWVSDSNHNHLGQTWAGTNNPLKIQGTFGAPDYAALVLNNTSAHGLAINNVGLDGIYVGTAGAYGMVVNDAAWDGVYVNVAGNPSTATFSSENNGFEVAGAQGYGLYVGRADSSGVVVESAGSFGVRVQSAGSHGVRVDSPGSDGLHVVFAGRNGVDVAGNDMAGYFDGPVQINGACTGCLLATFGVNTGDTPLAAGDLVSLAGLRNSGVDNVPMLLEVQAATGGEAVVGVVQGWAELITEEEPRPTEIGLRLVPRAGAAEPGQYVTIAYSGLAQVKASGPVEKGARLTVGDDGRARTLQTRTLDGMEVTEGAQPIGVALEGLDDSDGLIWVLVNVQ